MLFLSDMNLCALNVTNKFSNGELGFICLVNSIFYEFAFERFEGGGTVRVIEKVKGRRVAPSSDHSTLELFDSLEFYREPHSTRSYINCKKAAVEFLLRLHLHRRHLNNELVHCGNKCYTHQDSFWGNKNAQHLKKEKKGSEVL